MAAQSHSYRDADEYDEMMKAVKILMVMIKVIIFSWGSHRHGHRNHSKTVSVKC